VGPDPLTGPPGLASGGVTDRRPLIIDGNNVMGAAPDGWWRDRAGAARRLVRRVQCYAAATDRPVTIVFDVPFPEMPEGVHDGVTIRYATRRGRNAADDRIVELLQDVHEPIEVVTSDGDLGVRAGAEGRSRTGAGAFLRVLTEHGC
jgi:predicted RNA-binding protein with PIN domain